MEGYYISEPVAELKVVRRALEEDVYKRQTLPFSTARHLVESLKSTPFLAYSFCSILEISRSVGPAMWSSISTTVTWEPATQ